MIDCGDGILIRMTNASWDELEQCEWGSYEDHIVDEQCPQCNGSGVCPTRKCIKCNGRGTITVRQEPYHDGLLHIVELIQRRGKSTRLVLSTQQEVDEFFGAACTGTFGLYKLQVLQRIYKQLEPFVSAERKVRISYGSLGL